MRRKVNFKNMPHNFPSFLFKVLLEVLDMAEAADIDTGGSLTDWTSEEGNFTLAIASPFFGGTLFSMLIAGTVTFPESTKSCHN